MMSIFYRLPKRKNGKRARVSKACTIVELRSFRAARIAQDNGGAENCAVPSGTQLFEPCAR